jgi:hypothetical protein
MGPEADWLLRGGSLDSAASCLPVGTGLAEQAEALGKRAKETILEAWARQALEQVRAARAVRR